jgi:ABC-type branched-subunit amino acid transport system permease subunit
MRDYLEEIRENWDNAYWRADHPEVMAILAAVLTGLVGLLFVWLELRLRRRVVYLPETRDV